MCSSDLVELDTVAGRDVTAFVMDGGWPLGSVRVASISDAAAGPVADPVVDWRDGIAAVTFRATASRTRLELAFTEAQPREAVSCPAGSAPPGSLVDKAAYLDQRVSSKLLDDGLIRTVREDGDGNVVSREHQPSTGLWTAIYLASQSFRWAVTHDTQALENARKAVEGLHHLAAVTGIPGLYGRAYQRPGFAYTNDAAGHAHWVASTAPGYEGWWWNDDVSKDTMDGIVFGYAVALDLLEDPGIRAAIRADLLAFARHLVTNGLQIIDHTGQVTEHGRMMYGVIDDFPGFNAMLTMSWLRTAVDAFEEMPAADRVAWDGPDLRHFLDDCLLRLGDRRDCPDLDGVDLGSYLDVAESLMVLYVAGCMTSYDQIDMIFQAVYPLLRRERRPAVRDRLLALLDRGIWEPAEEGIAPPVHRSTHSLYIFLHGAMRWPGVAPTFRPAWEDATCTLDGLPRDRRDLGATAPGIEAACTNRMGRGNAAQVIPLALRDYDNYLWRLDPYEIPQAREAVPDRVYSPEDFLLAYWLGRYAGFVSAGQ